LCDLAGITGDTSYINIAKQLADTFINTRVKLAPKLPAFPPTIIEPIRSSNYSGINDEGILTEYNDTISDYDIAGIDPRQFKGIFVRNLARLCVETHNLGDGAALRYSVFLRKNAASALRHKNSSNQFGASWSADVDTADFIRQTSAVDLLNAALTVQYIGTDLSYLDLLLGQVRGVDLSYLDLLLLD